jgi:hypothetical protein
MNVNREGSVDARENEHEKKAGNENEINKNARENENCDVNEAADGTVRI